MQSAAPTVEEYLQQLPPERREVLEVVRRVILKNLDQDYDELMQYGMIGYAVPHRVFPQGYHCDPQQPLPFAALASQKNYMSLYLMCIYGSDDLHEWFLTEWKKTGKKLDLGKSCLRFKRLEDLPLDLIGKLIKKVPAKKFVKHYQEALADRITKTGKRKKSSPPENRRA